MSALALYSSLPTPARALVRAAALRLAHPGERRAWRDSDPATESDHPALREALREWWRSVSTDEIAARIDTADERARELAIVLCAESVGHLSSDPRVAECRRVRLAWARGEATDEQRAAAIVAAWDAARGAARGAASAVSWDASNAAASGVSWDAAWFAVRAAAKASARDALAAPLRTLYPDPCEIHARCGLSRWDVAVAAARSCLRATGGAA